MQQILVPIVAIVFPIAMGFGCVYIYYTTRHRERMSMIERGMDPDSTKPASEPNKILRNGLLWTGIGVGLLAGWMFKHYLMGPVEEEHSALPLLIGAAIFGGLSQVIYYLRFARRPQD